MRPYIICHMAISIDGKVTGDFLSTKECADACEEYYRINREYQADAFACGSVTMEGGSIINGAFQREGLIDELSLVQVPIVAGSEGKPLFFDSQMELNELAELKRLDGGVNWLRYVKK